MEEKKKMISNDCSNFIKQAHHDGRIAENKRICIMIDMIDMMI